MCYSLTIPRRALLALALAILAAGALCAGVAHAQTTVVVANSANNQIASYALGGASPIRSIAGAATGLVDPTEIATDRAGNLYAANLQGFSVTVYAANATGNVAPIRKLAGATTGLRAPFAVAVDGTGRRVRVKRDR